MKLSFAERDLMSALTLYLGTRRTALRSALRLRAPLSVDEAEDLRIHYSNYFVSLMSAADLVAEDAKIQGPTFRTRLEAAFCRVSNPSSSANYSYVRELRNAVVHRGLNIASGAHFAGDFPLLVAPDPVTNQSGNQVHSSFGFYLLEVVEGCEAVVGPTIEAHLDTLGVLDKEPDVDALLEESRRFINASTVMPDWVKKMAPESLSSVDWNAIHRSSILKLRDLLKPLAFASPPEGGSRGAA